MREMTDREAGLCRLVRSVLRRKFDLFDNCHEVFAHLSENGISVAYRTEQNQKHSTCFDIQIQGNTCYTLFIGIAPNFRGKGFGKQLYHAIEEIARRSGCARVVLTASGWAYKQEPREKYMERIDYHKIQTGEMELILCQK